MRRLSRARIATRSLPGALLFVLATLLLAPSATLAEVLPDIGPTHAPTLRGDVLVLPVNAAGLGRMQGMQGRLLWEGDPGSGEEDSLRSGGFALGAGTGRGLGFGFASQWSNSVVRARHMQLGAAFGDELLSIGVARHWKVIRESSFLELFPDAESQEDARRRGGATQLSLQARPTPHLGLSVIVDNLEKGRVGDADLQREWSTSLALRTREEAVGTELLYRAAEGDLGRGTLAAVLQVRPHRAIRIWGGAAFDEPFHGTRDFTVSLGLQGLFGASSLETWTRAGASTRVGMSVGVDSLPAARPIGEGRNVVLVVRLDEGLREAPARGIFAPTAPIFANQVHRLQQACTSPEIRAVLLVFDGWRPGAAQMDELASAIEGARATCGMPSAAWLRSGDLRTLRIAAATDRTLLHPSFVLEGAGLSAGGYYFGGLLTRLGIEAQVVAVGPWKTAPERFSRKGPSEQEQEQLARWMDHAWEETWRPLARLRDLSEDSLLAHLAQAPMPADAVVAADLADAMIADFEIRDDLIGWLGAPVVLNSEIEAERIQPLAWHDRPSIAVLHIDGLIADADGGLFAQGLATPERIRDAIETITADPDIAGVVIRVSSGGGSAGASDTIRTLIRRLPPHLPVAVSLGDVAASGGYYVAAARTGIPVYAAPATLTGSIGIYTASASFDLLLSRLGIARYREVRGGSSALYSGRSWTEAERAGILRTLEFAYGRFLDAVAEGRGIERSAVEEAAGGRIWSGRDALDHSLVDSIGGLGAALADVHSRSSAANAPLGALTLRHYPQRGPGLLQGAGSLLISGVEAGPLGNRPAGVDAEAALRALVPDSLLDALSAAWVLHASEALLPLAHLPGWYPERPPERTQSTPLALD